MPEHLFDRRYLRQYVKAHTRRKGDCWLFVGPMGGRKPHPEIQIDGVQYTLAGISLYAFNRTDNPVTAKHRRMFCRTCGRKSCLNPDHIEVNSRGNSPLYHKLDPAYVRRLIRSRVIRDPKTRCWLWVRGRNQSGYGQLMVAGRRILAHRASLWAFSENDSVLNDTSLHIRHSCDVPACVNPAHLKQGTVTENIHDALNRGRRERTHCRNGHPYSKFGVFIGKKKRSRKCKACQNDTARRCSEQIAKRIRQLQRGAV